MTQADLQNFGASQRTSSIPTIDIRIVVDHQPKTPGCDALVPSFGWYTIRFGQECANVQYLKAGKIFF